MSTPQQQYYYQQPQTYPPQQYPGAPPQAPYQQPFGMEPPEANTIRDLLKIAGLFAMLFIIIWLLVCIWPIYVLLTFRISTGWAIIVLIFFVIWSIMNYMIYVQCNKLTAMLNHRRYIEAKNATLIWIIIGFIFGGFITAILLLLAYLKFDDLIRWGQFGQYPPGPTPYYHPQSQYPQPQYPPAYPPQYQPPPPGH